MVELWWSYGEVMGEVFTRVFVFCAADVISGYLFKSLPIGRRTVQR